MSSPPEIAAEFVRSYYTKLIYFPAEIAKFYDEEHATVWRDTIKASLAVPFAAARAFLVPHIEEGSTVSVSSFHVLPIDKGLSLVVEGAIARGNVCHFFTQFFTLGSAEGRFFVVADSLSIRPPESQIPPPTDNLVAVAPPKRDDAEAEPKPAPKGKRAQKRKDVGSNKFIYTAQEGS
jgi:hypothetical protein